MRWIISTISPESAEDLPSAASKAALRANSAAAIPRCFAAFSTRSH